MNTNLGRLSDSERDRALARAQAAAPLIVITEIGDGFLRANVECQKSCGQHQYNDGWHDVVIRHDGGITCSCIATKGLCLHAAAVLIREMGALPDPPVTCEGRGCGAALFYEWGGNGHHFECSKATDPGEHYQRPGSKPGRRAADELSPSATARNVVPMSEGRAKLINKTRPHLRIDGDRVVIRRPCGCVAWEGRLSDQGDFALPLSPMEGCPEHYDHMQPPAPDQVRARQEVR